VWQDRRVVERGDRAMVIVTDRLVFRRWRLDEADRFFDIYRRPEVVRWIGAEPMQDPREAIDMTERSPDGDGGDAAAGGLALASA
jgi:RimJ/RimL family protein N-acetyltransferase